MPYFLPPGFCLFLVTKFLSRGTLQKYLLGYLPSNVPSWVPLGYFITGGQAPPFQPPSKYPSPQTLCKCHIMCPKFTLRVHSFQCTFLGTSWLLYNKWTSATFPTTFQIPFTPNPLQVPYHVPKNYFESTFLPMYLLLCPLSTL